MHASIYVPENLPKEFTGKITRNNQEFIGTKIITKEKAEILIRCVSTKIAGGKATFIGECSVCSEDATLWPFGSIVGTKSNFSKGQTSCGCSSDTKWKRWQYEERIKRFCDRKGYFFKGYNGEWKGSHTKVVLYNPETGNEWDSSTIGNLFSRDVSDPFLTGKFSSEEKTIENVCNLCKEFGFDNLTPVERTNKTKGHSRIYIFECEVCSKDKRLWPYGSIKCSLGNIRARQIPCGCSYKPVYKDWQNVERVTRECVTRGYVFEGYHGDYDGVNTYLKLYNPASGNSWTTTTVIRFLAGQGDPSLASGGFKTDKDGYLYITLWRNPEGSCWLKYGITNLPVSKREKEQRKGTDLVSETLITLSGNGQVIYDLEKKFKHKVFKDLTGHVGFEDMPDGFSETLPFTEDVAKRIWNELVKHTDDLEMKTTEDFYKYKDMFY